MMNIDKDKCIGCGLCLKDCFAKDINIIDEKAKINNVNCFKCGHCVAICPKNAIEADHYNMGDVKNYNRDEFDISADNLLNFIKFRRSVRHFKNKDVEPEKILSIIEAGRFTQTARNSQNVSYVVIRNGIEELKGLALESLNDKGQGILADLSPESAQFKRYAKMWINMYEKHKVNPKVEDSLFFNAPATILVVSDSQVNASLASSNMELMTNALGLGTFFSGFFVMASQGNRKVMDYLGLGKNEQIVTCMVVGYPDIKYSRTVPRKSADIKWK